MKLFEIKQVIKSINPQTAAEIAAYAEGYFAGTHGGRNASTYEDCLEVEVLELQLLRKELRSISLDWREELELEARGRLLSERLEREASLHPEKWVRTPDGHLRRLRTRKTSASL